MDKSVLTSGDIEILKNESRKLQKGEVVIATLSSRIIYKDGEPQIVKAINIEDENNEILNFPGVSPLIGDGIKGLAVIEAFKKAKKETHQKEPFSLKRFFSKMETVVNNVKLNTGRIIYKYDEFGRVYIIVDDKKIFLNKERTKGITEDGHFADVILHEDSIELNYYYDEDVPYEPDLVNFSYLYISRDYEEKARDLITEEEEKEYNSFPSDLNIDYFTEEDRSSSKVIDLAMYRENLEDKGPSRR